MNIVRAPLNTMHGAVPPSANRFVYVMQAGQLLIALLLVSFGAARAISTGVSTPAAVTIGVALFVWQIFGVTVPGLTRSARASFVWLTIFLSMWITAVVISPEFVWLAFLLWLLAGHLLSLWRGIIFSVLIFVVITVAPVLHHGETTYANVIGPLIGGVFAFGISRGYLQLLQDAMERERLVVNLTRAQQETAQLQLEVALAQRHSGAVQERTRIARDIHDTVAQTLSSIRLLAHAQVKELENHEELNLSSLHQVETIAAESLSDVRRIIQDLTPVQLEGASIHTALNHLVNRLQTETGLNVRIDFDELSGPLSDEVEVALLRTAQSAFANVRKHARATRVAVTLTDTADQVRLDIIDDGVGFDVAKWEGAFKEHTDSFGLRFMRQRLRELGGGLELQSSADAGTAVSIFLPKIMKA